MSKNGLQLLRSTPHLTGIFGALLLAAGVAPEARASDGHCQVSLSESRVDFGQIQRTSVQPTGAQTPLAKRTATLVLNCAQPTDLHLNYLGTAEGAEHYALAGGASYGLQVRDVVVDGRGAELGLTDSAGVSPGTTASAQTWAPGRLLVPTLDGVPARGKQLTAQVEISAYAPDRMMRVKEASHWQAEGQLGLLATGDSAALSVSMQASPASCSVVLANGGVVDFQHIPASSLQSASSTTLPEKSIDLTVSCAAPALFALKVRDARTGTANIADDATVFGLGRDARRAALGHYRIRVDPSQTTADTHSTLYRTTAAADGQQWTSGTTSAMHLSTTELLGFSATDSSAGPSDLQTLNVPLTIQAEIAPTQSLDLSSEVTLDGMATIELEYL